MEPPRGIPQKKAAQRRPIAPGEIPTRDLTPEDVPIEASGNHESDYLANLINGFGEVGITLYRTLDADTIDGLIFTSNQLRKDPQDRLDEYLKRCVDEHYKGREGDRMAALGVTEDMNVVSDRPADPMAVLKRIESSALKEG